MNKFIKRYEEITDGTGKRINFLNPTYIRLRLSEVKAAYEKVFKKVISLDKLFIILADRGIDSLIKELKEMDEKLNGK